MEDGTDQSVANLGPFRPPLIYLAAILSGLLLEAIAPLPFAAPTPLRIAGAVFIAAAVGLFFWAVRTFAAAGTPVPGNQPTVTIVRSGPYRFTRNPIYLAFSALQLGVALCASSLWTLVTLAVAVALMAGVVIPREERYLEAHFPAQYLPFKAEVRRWL